MTTKYIIYLEKETKSNIVKITRLLANEIVNYSGNDIVRSYEGQNSIFIDILIPTHCNIGSIENTINKCGIFTDNSIENQRHYFKGILKVDTSHLDYDELDNINGTKGFSYTYEISNLGATGMEFSFVEFINGSFMVVLVFISQILFRRFFRYESKGTDGDKCLRYYNEKKILRQLKKKTNKQIKNYEIIGHKIRKNKIGLVVEIRNKKNIYIIKTNIFSCIESYKKYKSKEYVINR